ncbi:hypothetical protein KY285_023761 [Solanum tuberosum]|nr:hypothetical protein KY289_024093 [Solanum tuberosum]KAH0675960.1 hypothetical protein KY285_023761 [Solanum tuberosum]
MKQALDVARGMEYVHDLNLIHRDLKSDNLLIVADKSIKIADFGVARIEVQTEGMKPVEHTAGWLHKCLEQSEQAEIRYRISLPLVVKKEFSCAWHMQRRIRPALEGACGHSGAYNTTLLTKEREEWLQT